MNRYNRIDSRLLLVALINLVVAGSLSAQPGQDGRRPPDLPDAERIEEMVDELAEALSLTEEQETDVNRLYTEHFDAARELMEANEGGRGGDRRAMEALREEFEEQVGEVLNDEQRSAYEKLLEERRPQPDRQRTRRK